LASFEEGRVPLYVLVGETNPFDGRHRSRSPSRIQHPVNEFHGREGQRQAKADTDFEIRVGLESAQDRAFRMIGTLLDLSIKNADDIRTQLNDLTEKEARAHATT